MTRAPKPKADSLAHYDAIMQRMASGRSTVATKRKARAVTRQAKPKPKADGWAFH